MTRRRRAPEVRQDQAFKGRQFTAEVILWAVRWYLMLPVSYCDLELMLLDRAAMRFFRKALLDLNSDGLILGSPHRKSLNS
jgi:hypothetical protein